jgi:phosphoenolpyruvate synthase/pyruvate phosphate dikinase
VRIETSPEDVGGMHAAAGILTARGGMTSHAAVVARGWGKCCVSGCASVRVNDAEKVIDLFASTNKAVLLRRRHATEKFRKISLIVNTYLLCSVCMYRP